MSGRTMAALTGLALLACGRATAQDERRCAEAEAAAPIVERRQAFNAAIRDADLAAIEAALAPNIVLVSGTDSDLFRGRDAQLAIWRSDFEKQADDRMVLRAHAAVRRAIGPGSDRARARPLAGRGSRTRRSGGGRGSGVSRWRCS